jgi:hypothetical protein
MRTHTRTFRVINWEESSEGALCAGLSNQPLLSLDKMSAGLNAFEISGIQEEKPAPANLTIGV